MSSHHQLFSCLNLPHFRSLFIPTVFTLHIFFVHQMETSLSFHPSLLLWNFSQIPPECRVHTSKLSPAIWAQDSFSKRKDFLTSQISYIKHLRYISWCVWWPHAATTSSSGWFCIRLGVLAHWLFLCGCISHLSFHFLLSESHQGVTDTDVLLPQRS